MNTGIKVSSEIVICPKCDGFGIVAPLYDPSKRIPCSYCRSKGRIYKEIFHNQLEDHL